MGGIVAPGDGKTDGIAVDIVSGDGRDGGQLVSLCGSEPENGYTTWLQFRMGTKDKLALGWPKERKRPNRIFNVRRYTRYRLTLLKLDFHIGDKEYALLEDDLSEDKPQYSLPLRIPEAETEKEIALHELTPVTDRLSIMEGERYIEAKPYNE